MSRGPVASVSGPLPVGPAPRGPVVTPAREAVLSYVRRAVVLGVLQPGDKLREVRLAADLGVSRPTLREALNLLVQDGLLVHEPYRGFGITRLDPSAVRDLARTRVPLDMIAVAGILEDGAEQRRQVVRDVWEGFERAAFDPDPLVRHEAHLAFHHGLWVASENSMLLRLWPVTEALSTIALAQEQITRDDPRRAYDMHRRIVEAVLGGDPVAVEEQLRHHTVDSAEEYLALKEH